MIGEFAGKLDDVIRACGYTTESYQLVGSQGLKALDPASAATMISDAGYDLIMVNLPHLREERSEADMHIVKNMAAIMRRQLDDGRALIVYGQDCAYAWQCAEFTAIISDSSLHHARFRWCNIVARSQATQYKSIRSVTRVASSMQLWAGPLDADHWCTCHPSAHVSAKHLVGGCGNAKLRNQCWAEVAHYLIKLANSGVPLSPHTRRWGARPELHLQQTKVRTVQDAPKEVKQRKPGRATDVAEEAIKWTPGHDHDRVALQRLPVPNEEARSTNEKRHPTEAHGAGDAHANASPARPTSRGGSPLSMRDPVPPGDAPGGRTQRHLEGSSSQSRRSAGGVQALAATTLVACLTPGDAAEVRVTIAFSDPAPYESRAWVLMITLAVLLVSVALWSAMPRLTWSHLKTFLRSLRGSAAHCREPTETVGMVQRVDIDIGEVDEGSEDTGWEVLSGDGDDASSRRTEAMSVSSGAPAPANIRWTGGAAAQSGRRGAAEKASARRIAPRLAESKRFDAATDPLSPAQAWLQDFLMKFLRDQLRAEFKRGATLLLA